MFFPKCLNVLFIILLATCLMGCPSQGGDGSNDFVEGTNTPPATPAPAVTGPATPGDTTQSPATAFTFEVQVNRVNGTGFFSATISALTGTVTGLPVTVSFTTPALIVGSDPITFESTGTFLTPLTGPGTLLVTVTYNGEGSIAPYCFILGIGTAGGGTTTCGGGPPPVTELCANGIDDDGDGLIDGADPDCAAPPFDFSGVYVSDCEQLAGATCPGDPTGSGFGSFYVIIDHDPVGGTAGFLFCGPNEDAGDTAAGICIFTTSTVGLSSSITLTPGAGGVMTLPFPTTGLIVGDCAGTGVFSGGDFGPSGPFTFIMTPPVGAGEPTGVFTGVVFTGAWTGPTPPCPQSGSTRTFTRIAGTLGTTTDLPFSYPTVSGGCADF